MRMLHSNTKGIDAVLANARAGFAVGAIFTALQMVASMATSRDGFEGPAVPLYRWAVYFVVGGTIAGSIAGLLRSWTRSGLGAAIVGVIAFVPMSFLHSRLIDVNVQWDRPTILAYGLATIIFGGIGGLVVRRANNRRPSVTADRAAEPEL